MSEHFTAVIEITKTEQKPASTGGYGNKEVIPASREVHEISRIIVRADSINALVDKAQKHLALEIEPDDEDEDEDENEGLDI